AKLFEDAYGWKPRPFQVAGIQAQIEGVDTIVQAPTGAGKTAVVAGAHLWPHGATKVTIMVSPLLSLEDEMVRTFKEKYGLDAVAVNSQNGACSPRVVSVHCMNSRRQCATDFDILNMKYQIILASPEMLQSRTFINKILRNSRFTSHILSMVIDEAHCVSHWGADFRKKYASLGVIRAFLRRGTPVIALTATLTGRVRRDIQSKLHFPKHGSRFINFGNDRPNVALVVRAAEHPQNTYKDLDFVIPTSVTHPEDVPKTWIYVDNINTGTEITDYLSNLLETRLAGDANIPQPANLIRPFNATLSSEYRVAAMNAFRDGSVRILVCTEAAGMGCDIPDIDVVVQWKLPTTFSNFIQRAGRVARGPGRRGLAVLIVERSAYFLNLTIAAAEDHTGATHAGIGIHAGKAKAKGKPTTRGRKRKMPLQAKANKDYAEAHGVFRGGASREDSPPDGTQPDLDLEALDEGLLTFVQSTTCRRQVWANAFECIFSAPTGACCDICDPSLLDCTRPDTEARVTSAKRITLGLPDVKVQAALYHWHEEVYERDHEDAMFDSTAILDNATIARLSSTGNLSAEMLTSILKPSWCWWTTYSVDLLAHIAAMDISYIPRAKKQ
ncbi:P-loop containing nucleoside triphosphate hydrolase protein, partial [Daedalea quercina L-15889]